MSLDVDGAGQQPHTISLLPIIFTILQKEVDDKLPIASRQSPVESYELSIQSFAECSFEGHYFTWQRDHHPDHDFPVSV